MRKHDDLGVTAVIFALVFTVLVAAVGLGIDTSSLFLHRAKVQNSADAAALAVAYDCVQNKATCTPDGAKDTANYYATENAQGGDGSIPDGVSPSAGKVLVQVQQSVNTRFFAALGIGSKDVSAQARAKWSKHPVGGKPPLPFVVSLCEYANHLPGSTTPWLLRTGISAQIQQLTNGNTAKRDTDVVYPELAKFQTSCSVPAGVPATDTGAAGLTMLKSGLWLTGFNKTSGADDYVANNNVCNGHTRDLAGAAQTSGMSASCTQKYADELDKAGVGGIIYFAIYAPTANDDHFGIETEACGSKTCVVNNGVFDLKVVGYAPFKLTAWKIKNKASSTPMSLSLCPTIQFINQTLDCDGIEGYFVRTAAPNPDFEFEDSGTDLGSTKVELTQ